MDECIAATLSIVRARMAWLRSALASMESLEISLLELANGQFNLTSNHEIGLKELTFDDLTPANQGALEEPPPKIGRTMPMPTVEGVGFLYHTASEGILAVLRDQPDGMIWGQIQDALAGKFYTQSRQPRSIVSNALRTLTYSRRVFQAEPRDIYTSKYFLAANAPKNLSDESRVVADVAHKEGRGRYKKTTDEMRRSAVAAIGKDGPLHSEELAKRIKIPSIIIDAALNNCAWFEEEVDGWHITHAARMDVLTNDK